MAANKISPRATKKISELDSAESLSGSELIPIVQNGTTRKTTTDQIAGDVVSKVEVLLNNFGYEVPVPFKEGLVIRRPSQTVEYNGEVYAPVPSAVPFTTTVLFNLSQWRLIQGVTAGDLGSAAFVDVDILATAEQGLLAEGATQAAELASTDFDKGAALVGFRQEASEAVNRTALEKLRDLPITPADFGAAGDGVQDDTGALIAALESGRPLDWGDRVYRITSPINIAAASEVLWKSGGARIVADFASPQQRAVTITGMAGSANYIGPLTIDAQDKAFVGLRVMAAADAAASIVIDRPHIENVRRSSADYTEGNGIFVTGDFNRVDILHPTIRNVTMAAAAGVPGAAGVTGISVRAGSGRPKLINIVEPYIENVSSDDLSYTSDQDGILIWTDRSTSDVIRPTTVSIKGGFFKNCLGRSIKCQVESAHIAGPKIYRDTGFTVSTILPDIDLQIGGGRVTGVSAHYDGVSHKPQSLVLLNTPDVEGKAVPIGTVAGAQVTLTNGAVMQQVVMCATRDRTKCAYRVSDISVDGDGLSYLARLIGVDNGDFYLAINGADARIGVAAVLASNGPATGYVSMRDVVNLSGTDVPIVSAITGFRPFQSAVGCYGFADAKDASTSNVIDMVFRVPAIAPEGAADSGVFRPVSFRLNDGETFKFPQSFRNVQTGMLLVSVGASRNDQGLFACDNALVVKLAGGPGIEVGGTTEPVSGNFRLWTGAEGPQISNRSGAARTLTCFMIG